jgi:hypothetical protein
VDTGNANEIKEKALKDIPAIEEDSKPTFVPRKENPNISIIEPAGWVLYKKNNRNNYNISEYKILKGVSNSKEYNSTYKRIVDAIRIVIPFFEDFRHDTFMAGQAEKVKLSWKQKNSDYPMQPYHLSDGSIRFICLATALLQPNPPSTIVIDEPELGLPPETIGILAELIKLASQKTQVIIATQSPLLLDQFSIEDIIVARRKNGASTFERLKEKDYLDWLENYTIGELWTKNVICGGTSHE